MLGWRFVLATHLLESFTFSNSQTLRLVRTLLDDSPLGVEVDGLSLVRTHLEHGCSELSRELFRLCLVDVVLVRRQYPRRGLVEDRSLRAGILLGEVQLGSCLRLNLGRASRLDDFDFPSYLEKVLHVAEISAHDRPLVHEAVLDLRVAGVEVQKLKWFSLFALLLDECFCVEDLV